MKLNSLIIALVVLAAVVFHNGESKHNGRKKAISKQEKQKENSDKGGKYMHRNKLSQSDKIAKRNHRRKCKKTENNCQNADGKDNKQNTLLLVIDQTEVLRRNITTYSGHPISGWKSTIFNHTFLQGDVRTGTFTVTQPGLYLIFAKITFSKYTHAWSHYRIHKGRGIFTTCMSDNATEIVGNQLCTYCFINQVANFNKTETVSLKSVHHGWVLVPDEDKTYWGMTKLA